MYSRTLDGRNWLSKVSGSDGLYPSDFTGADTRFDGVFTRIQFSPPHFAGATLGMA